MANVHIQVGRYHLNWGNCNQGHADDRRINFARGFDSAPKVFTSIYHYDLCWDRHKYNRIVTWPHAVDAKGFNSIGKTWGDSMVYGMGVEVGILSLLVRQPFPTCAPDPKRACVSFLKLLLGR
jgi:hypothetical protein